MVADSLSGSTPMITAATPLLLALETSTKGGEGTATSS
jgi:hypothetical protein